MLSPLYSILVEISQSLQKLPGMHTTTLLCSASVSLRNEAEEVRWAHSNARSLFLFIIYFCVVLQRASKWHAAVLASLQKCCISRNVMDLSPLVMFSAEKMLLPRGTARANPNMA